MTYLDEYLDNRKNYSKLVMSGAVDSETKKRHKARQDELLQLMSIADIRELIKQTNNPQAQAHFYDVIKRRSVDPTVATITIESYKQIQNNGSYVITPQVAIRAYEIISSLARCISKKSVITATAPTAVVNPLFHPIDNNSASSFRRGQ